MVHVVNGRIYQHQMPDEEKDKVEEPVVAAVDEGELPFDDGLNDIRPKR